MCQGDAHAHRTRHRGDRRHRPCLCPAAGRRRSLPRPGRPRRGAAAPNGGRAGQRPRRAHRSDRRGPRRPRRARAGSRPGWPTPPGPSTCSSTTRATRLNTPFLASEVDDEESLLRVLVLAVLRLSHAGARAMAARGNGAIINVSSVGGIRPDGALLRRQGVGDELLRGSVRGVGRNRSEGVGAVPGLHAYGVPSAGRHRHQRDLLGAVARRRRGRRGALRDLAGRPGGECPWGAVPGAHGGGPAGAASRGSRRSAPGPTVAAAAADLHTSSA